MLRLALSGEIQWISGLGLGKWGVRYIFFSNVTKKEKKPRIKIKFPQINIKRNWHVLKQNYMHNHLLIWTKVVGQKKKYERRLQSSMSDLTYFINHNLIIQIDLASPWTILLHSPSLKLVHTYRLTYGCRHGRNYITIVFFFSSSGWKVKRQV